MDATCRRPADPPSSWETAERLADEIAAGGSLPELVSAVLLEVGEVLHATLDVEAWRYLALDVTYPQTRGFIIGGPIMLGIGAAAKAAANRRARAEAERLAAPQWRSLGDVQMLATSHRLLVFHEGTWASVWYNAIRQIRPALAQDRFELYFENDPPYLLQGPSVPYLAVVIATALANELGTAAVADALLLV